MRWIDAEWLTKYFKRGKEYKGEYVLDDLKYEAPSIDIVRCRECRYCKKKRGTFKGEPIIFYRCTENNRDVEADDFCSYGERSEP